MNIKTVNVLKKSKIKILFVIPTLTAGGAERIMSFLPKNLDASMFECSLIVAGSPQNMAYDIENIKVKFLNKKRVLFSIPDLIKCFAKEKPQIVMGSIAHLNFTLGFISILFPNIIFIGRQAGITKISSVHNTRRKNRLFDFSMTIGLSKLDYVICQSVDMREDCIEVFNITPKKLKVIHNPITDNFKVKNTVEHYNTKIDTYRFITVGRLVRIKGHMRILEVLSKFELPFMYTIIGDGPEKNTLIEKINSLNLIENIKIIDFTKEVSKYLGHSDFFLQGSFSEGFPNALLESCAVGTPVIAFNAPGGTREIVEDGVNGYLVKDEDAFLNRLNNLESFDPKRVSESVYKKFSKSIILSEYETFFQNIVANR